MNFYAETILDLWRNPVNFGELENADLEADQLNPLCGDEVKIQLKLDKIGTLSQIPWQKLNSSQLAIYDARFTGNGCAISIASASLLTEFAKGKKLVELTKLTEKDLISLLGIEVGPARIKCAILPLVTLKKALASFDEKTESPN